MIVLRLQLPSVYTPSHPCLYVGELQLLAAEPILSTPEQRGAGARRAYGVLLQRDGMSSGGFLKLHSCYPCQTLRYNVDNRLE